MPIGIDKLVDEFGDGAQKVVRTESWDVVVRSIASRMVWVMVVVRSFCESVIYRSNVVVEGITRVMVVMYVEVMGIAQIFAEG